MEFQHLFYAILLLKWSEITSKRHQKFIISDYLSEESHFGVPRAHFGPHLGAIWSPLGSILILWDALWSQFWELWLPYGCFLLVWNRICQDFGCCWSHFGFIFAALHTSFILVSFYNFFALAPHKHKHISSTKTGPHTHTTTKGSAAFTKRKQFLRRAAQTCPPLVIVSFGYH